MIPDYDITAQALRSRLSLSGLEHSFRVAETAAALAGVYDVDVSKARFAGLVHDWCKDIPGQELVRLAEDAGLPVDDVDRAVPYLLHGPVASVVLAAQFPDLPHDVLAAVADHTYGSADIDELGMIVYIADTIEPGRTHPGVELLRGEVGEISLPQLFERTYAASLQHLVERRTPIHPATLATWNSRIAGERR